MSEQEANLYVSKHLPSFLDTIKECEKEMVRCLDFNSFGFSACHLSCVVDFLQDSRTVELSLDGNDLSHALASVAEKLSQTKLQKLSITSRRLLESDIMCLALVLKDTAISDLELLHLKAIFTKEQAEEFVSNLQSSHLTKLVMPYCKFFKNAGAVCFSLSLPSTAITHLNLRNSLHDKVALVCLWAVLPQTLIIDLDLSVNEITHAELEPLKETLRKSKLERLNLESNKISDAGVDILAKALVSSTVTDLSLQNNDISGKNILGSYLKDTKINILDLSFNTVEDSEMFSFPDFVKETSVSTLNLEFCRLNDQTGESLMRSLKSSKVVKLNVGSNDFGLGTVTEFAKVVKDTDVTEVVFSLNSIPYEGLSILAQFLNGSKVKRIEFECMKNLPRIHDGKKDSSTFIETFFEESRGSEINFVNFCGNSINSSGAERFVKSLTGTTITNLNLSTCSIGGAVIINLAASMKFTCITHLILSGNHFRDKGAEALAVCLPETQISTLNLSNNMITARGGLRLVSCLKRTSLYVLDLAENRIDKKGMKEFAKTVEGTFVTELKAEENDDWQQFIIDPVLWKNRASVHKLLEFVKRIAPKTPDDDSFCFDCKEDAYVSEFLDECLHFSKAIEEASAINAITHAGILSRPRNQVAKLFLEEFPRQLALFVGTRVETHIEQHVRFVEKADDMELNKVVDFLLLNRPNLMIDRDQGILHPRIYPLLVKYKQPMFNLNIEAQGRVKIIKYFTENIEYIQSRCPEFVQSICTEFIQSAVKVIEILSDETMN